MGRGRQSGAMAAQPGNEHDGMQPHRDHAIITGGSSGIGLALAAELSRQGCAVSLIARGEERLSAARALLVAAGAAVADQGLLGTDTIDQ